MVTLHEVTLLFNLVLITGKIPSSWAIGCITPLYKGKGSVDDPDNFRGITVLSCLGKLFTSVLNSRINTFLENNNLIGNEQAGFRANNSTNDHIFFQFRKFNMIELFAFFERNLCL